MRGRPAQVPASAVLDEVRHLIASAAGAPCPTLDAMTSATGATVWCVRSALAMLRAAGQLQVRRSARVVAQAGFRRKMRVLVGGQWSGWTAWTRREVGEIRELAPPPEHLAAVTAAGRF